MSGILPTLEKLSFARKKAGVVNENHARFDSSLCRLIRADRRLKAEIIGRNHQHTVAEHTPLHD